MSSSPVAAINNGSTAALSTTLGSDGVVMCSGGNADSSTGQQQEDECSLAGVVSALETAAAAQQALYAKYNTAAQPDGCKVRQAVEAAVMVSARGIYYALHVHVYFKKNS